MPQPPDDTKSSLLEHVVGLSESIRLERMNADNRHDQILVCLHEQQRSFKEQLSEIRELTKSALASKIGRRSFSSQQEFSLVQSRGSSCPSPSFSHVSHLKLTPSLPVETTKQASLGSRSSGFGLSSGPSSLAKLRDRIDSGVDTLSDLTHSHEKSTRAIVPRSTRLKFGSMTMTSSSMGSSGSMSSWRYWLKAWVKSDAFEVGVVVLILANCVVQCFETQYVGFSLCFDLQFRGCKDDSHDVWPNADTVFLVLDWIFNIVFALEVVIKTCLFRMAYFRSAWNYVDIFCVLGFIVDKIASAVLPVDGHIVRLLRTFRLMRLVRLMRFLEEAEGLYIMTSAISESCRILLWAIALLTLVLMTCALILTQGLHATHFNNASASQLSAEELEEYHRLYQYFGSFTRCMLSMFELTLANWPPVVRLLSEQVSEWFTLLGVIHKLIVGFAVIGVLNGVIMKETFNAAANDDVVMLREKLRDKEREKKKMLNLFGALDISGDGSLDMGEWLIISSDPHVRTWLGSMGIETDDLQTLFLLIDSNSDGEISVDELVERMPRIKGGARSIDVLALNSLVAQLLQSSGNPLNSSEGVSSLS